MDVLTALKDESIVVKKAVQDHQKANQELEITAKRQQDKNRRLIAANLDLRTKCQDVEDQAMRAEDALVQLRKYLHEVLEQKDTLVAEVAAVTRESDTHKANLEASQEEIGLLFAQRANRVERADHTATEVGPR